MGRAHRFLSSIRRCEVVTDRGEQSLLRSGNPCTRGCFLQCGIAERAARPPPGPSAALDREIGFRLARTPSRNPTTVGDIDTCTDNSLGTNRCSSSAGAGNTVTEHSLRTTRIPASTIRDFGDVDTITVTENSPCPTRCPGSAGTVRDCGTIECIPDVFLPITSGDRQRNVDGFGDIGLAMDSYREPGCAAVRFACRVVVNGAPYLPIVRSVGAPPADIGSGGGRGIRAGRGGQPVEIPVARTRFGPAGVGRVRRKRLLRRTPIGEFGRPREFAYGRTTPGTPGACGTTAPERGGR